jgi:hypothetical protein
MATTFSWWERETYGATAAVKTKTIYATNVYRPHYETGKLKN